MSTQTEKFLSVVSAAGKDGVKTTELQKLLGDKPINAIHSAAHELKKKGYVFKNRKATYFFISGPAESSKPTTAVVPVKETINEHGPIYVMGLTISQKVVCNMDEASRIDLIEQLRRSQLHLSIAQAIVDSHKMASELKERL